MLACGGPPLAPSIGRGLLGGALGAGLAAAWLMLAAAVGGGGTGAHLLAPASPGRLPAGVVGHPLAEALVGALWLITLGTLAGGVAGGVGGAFAIRGRRRALAAVGGGCGLGVWALTESGVLAPVTVAAATAPFTAAVAYTVYGAVLGGFMAARPVHGRSG